MLRTETPTTSGANSSSARRSARMGSRSNIMSSTRASCPARPAASATMHAPMGMTGTGSRQRFVLTIRTFMRAIIRACGRDAHTAPVCRSSIPTPLGETPRGSRPEAGAT